MVTSLCVSRPLHDSEHSIAGDNHKGSHGKVSVIGGSPAFTGAPFYAASAAMQVGADYGIVFCSADAAAPIKSYSPELIVIPCMLTAPEALAQQVWPPPPRHCHPIATQTEQQKLFNLQASVAGTICALGCPQYPGRRL